MSSPEQVQSIALHARDAGTASSARRTGITSSKRP
jgi:hypothetical protein